MNSKNVILIIAGIAIGAALIFIVSQKDEPSIEINSIDFTYDDNLKIRQALDSYDIVMSTPLKFEGDAIDQYCTFFGDADIQEQIEFCTSTELKDSSGQFLGNIHMIGSSKSPQMVISVIQTDPFVSQEDDMVLIFDAVIVNMVCDCWTEIKPGGFSSVSDWIKAAKIHHLEAKRTTSKSEISGLGQNEILLEITTNTEGYLWKLLVDK